MKFALRTHLTLALALALLAASCPFSSDDAGSTDPADLIGMWYWTDGVDASWIEFSEPDQVTNIYEGLVDQYCDQATGTWTASGGALSLTFTVENGAPTLDVETLTFEILDGALVIQQAGEPEQTWERVGSIPEC